MKRNYPDVVNHLEVDRNRIGRLQDDVVVVVPGLEKAARNAAGDATIPRAQVDVVVADLPEVVVSWVPGPLPSSA